MPLIGPRSMTIPPSQTDAPGKLCPPPRTAMTRSFCLANLTAAMTSATPAQRAIRAGERSIDPFQTLRPSSYARSVGRMSCPRNEPSSSFRATSSSWISEAMTVRTRSLAARCEPYNQAASGSGSYACRMNRYGKRADLIVHEDDPFNAETGLAALAEGPLTATDAFYVRGHGPVPEIDPAAWRLHVHGLVARELDLSLPTLREAFRERTETATLQCAGNRRAGLMAIRDIPGEAPWGPGATGTATWSGVALADVLALAGPARGAAHVGFAGADLALDAKPAQRFG